MCPSVRKYKNGLWTDSLAGGLFPIMLRARQLSIPALYQTPTPLRCGTDTSTFVSVLSRSKPIHQHYTGSMHYSTGIIGRPLLCSYIPIFPDTAVVWGNKTSRTY